MWDKVAARLNTPHLTVFCGGSYKCNIPFLQPVFHLSFLGSFWNMAVPYLHCPLKIIIIIIIIIVIIMRIIKQYVTNNCSLLCNSLFLITHFDSNITCLRVTDQRASQNNHFCINFYRFSVLRSFLLYESTVL